jgi:hypothetical protein
LGWAFLQWLSILFCFGYGVLGLDRIFGLSIGELGEMTGETTTARAKAKADPYGMTNKKGNGNGNDNRNGNRRFFDCVTRKVRELLTG